MQTSLKNLVDAVLPPVRKLRQHRNDLISRVAGLETERRQLQSDLAAGEAENARLRSAIAERETRDARRHPLNYEGDGMLLWDKNLKSLSDPIFVDAYNRSSHPDVPIQFRAYVCCWAARQAAKLDGDFVECGVNEGWLSLTICHYLDFNALAKSFYLFDTYQGIPKEQIAESEAVRAALHHYPDCYELAKERFAEFPRAKLVRGKVPDTLNNVAIDRVSYLSIDMNIEKPERAAIEFFWPKLVVGGVVVLDDYAFGGYEKQHDSMDQFAAKVGVTILTLPTGQGLIFKS
jgi:O-methyltransferase